MVFADQEVTFSWNHYFWQATSPVSPLADSTV